MRILQYRRKPWLGAVCIMLLCLAFVPLASHQAFGQVDQGAISGFVQDATGAVIANASVTLTSTDTGLTLQSRTDASGGYNFSPVRIGNYKVSATATGFSTTTQSNIVVNVQQHVEVTLKLKPGSESQTVEVTAAEPQLQTEDASVGQVINQKSVVDLPLNGRNFTFLAQLAAGVNTPQADTRGNAATGAFSANGLRPAQNNYLLDGVDNNSDTVDFLNGTNYVVLPPVDAVQEFKVQTSDFSAEFGRSGAAVLNASIKSGTNAFHGAAWEFFRNDALDAKDYFEQNSRKGELRQNQYGGAIGGPIIKNKLFFFGDYEGTRRLQGTILAANVPTTLERSSGFTNLADLLQSPDPNDPTKNVKTDLLGRTVPVGTVFDPSTTRAVTAGSPDPISGLLASSNGFVRDPFGTCGPGTTSFTADACGLNQLPANRLDANAIALLNLYPNPTSSGISQNFSNSPKLSESRRAFDVRGDYNFNERNQIFSRFSYVDDPQNIPAVFGGTADGGAFQQGIQTALSKQFVVAYTHVFTPSTINVARFGLNDLHTTRNTQLGNTTTNIPAQFGILGIPQHAENGGLPTFGVSGLTSLGGSAFLPSDETSKTQQYTDDFTKTFGKHTFKAGIEYQRVSFSTLQPGWSRGEFDFGDTYVDIPDKGGSNVGRAAFLLSPTASTVGGNDYVGGPNSVFASNIATTDDGKNYFGAYAQDDWKVSRNLTVNLGLRWDYFGLIYEKNGKQANFVPSGGPGGGPQYLIPGNTSLSSLNPAFPALLAQDGIALKIGNSSGLGLGTVQHNNFAPRFGFAYSANSKLVVRGGFGIFYNAFENRGYGPNIGENYPFVFNVSYFNKNSATPISSGSPYAGCSTASAGGSATLESGLSCFSFDPATVSPSGLGLEGIQYKYITPYTMSANLTLQYQLTPTLSIQTGWVTTQARHLETSPGTNNVTQLLANNDDGGLSRPFQDFGRGSSYRVTNGNSNYHGLQTKVEKSFSNGLSLLFTHTWAKALSDAGDSLNGGSLSGYRAPDIPGFGVHRDYTLASFNIKNVIHISGGYELPFGKGKHFMANATGVAQTALGGWSLNWVATLQGGQPITLSCPNGTATGAGCYDLKVAGQDPKLGIHRFSVTNSDGSVSNYTGFFGNPAAFTQPCQLGRDSGGNLIPLLGSPAGCVPLSGLAALGGQGGQVDGPGYHRLDLSLFKDIHLTERFKLQFRTEAFNILNHPNFNAPNFGGNGVNAIAGSGNYTNPAFGAVGATRDAPYAARQIQFGLKLYF